MYESNDMMVSHPSHYIRGGMEVIDVIEAFTSDLKGIEATDTGNIIKYICRWKEKGGIQDIEKVLWYASHLRDHLLKEKEKVVIKESKTIGDIFYGPEPPMTWTFTATLEDNDESNK